MFKPQGWYNAFDFPGEWTAHNTTTAGDGHAAWQALSGNHKEALATIKAEQAYYTDGKGHVLRFRPHMEVFQLSKLLVPRVQIGIQMYFNPPNLFLNGVELAGRLLPEDIKVRLYLYQIRLNPSVYRALMSKMSVDRQLVPIRQ